MIYRICLIILPFFLLTILLFVIFGNKIVESGSECTIRRLTGFYCLGCGGTRAFNYFVHLHVIKSFLFHPFVPYGIFAYVWYTVNSFLHRHNKKCFSKLNPFILIYVGIGLIVLNFIVRNILVLMHIYTL